MAPEPSSHTPTTLLTLALPIFIPMTFVVTILSYGALNIPARQEFYIGQFSAGREHGFGRRVTANYVYEGEWKCGVQHVRATL
jgi:hypothetical protein